MSELSNFLASLEAKVKQTEANVANALSQYHGLTGILAGLQTALSEAKAVADVVAPASAIDAGINTAAELVSVADSIEQSSQLDASPAPEDVPQ